jgi:hypothetical protein
MTDAERPAIAGELAGVTSAGVALVLALAFALVFFTVKHHLAAVSPFVDDPYDAVGSFGIQIALAAAMASAARAIVCPIAASGDRERLFILRGHAVVLTAILVTALSDVVAIGRHLSISFASPAGRAVTVLTAGVVAASAAAVAGLVRMTHTVVPIRRWCFAALLCLGEVVILAAYPEESRRSVPGALAAAFMGMAVVLSATWGLTETLLPSDRTAESLLERIGAALGITGEGRPARLLHHPWRYLTAAAVAAGAALVAVEALGEGLPSGSGRVVMLVSVIVGIETGGIPLGAVMFRRPLGLF